MKHLRSSCDETESNRLFKATYIVEVCVVDWGLLHTNVEDDEDGMYQITSKANVGNWNPEAQRQEALDKT